MQWQNAVHLFHVFLNDFPIIQKITLCLSAQQCQFEQQYVSHYTLLGVLHP